MKCVNCGTEFEGKFCPNCGTAAVQPAEPAGEAAPTAQAAPAPAKSAGRGISKKTMTIGAAVLVVVLIIIAASVAGHSRKKDAFNEASALLDAGDYEAAASAFAQIDEEDAEEKYRESVYRDAYASLEKGDYAKAAEQLANIDDYYNSEDLKAFCEVENACADIQALCSQGAFATAYEQLSALPVCAETAALLQDMIAQNTVDMTVVRHDYSENSVRATDVYSGRFYFIKGTVSGFSTSFLEGERYMILDINEVSDDIHCYDMTDADVRSVNTGESVIVAGNYGYDYGWIGIDFKACSLIGQDRLYASDSIMQMLDLTNALSEDGSGSTVAVPTPAPTPEPTANPMEEVAGAYLLTDAQFDDEDAALDWAVVDLFSAEFKLYLYADGTGRAQLLGNSEDLTWDENIVDNGDGNPSTWRYENGLLYMDAVGEHLVFERINE